MKKLMTILSAAALLLAGCGKPEDKSSDSSGSGWRLVSTWDMYEEEKHGSFVLDQNGRLDFLDLETMERTPFCNDATCRHEPLKGPEDEWNGKVCAAYGKYNHPFLYSDKLYYFRSTEFEQREDGMLSQGVQLWQCDVGGGSEKQLTELKMLTIRDYDKALLKDGRLWTLLTDEPLDPNNVMQPSHFELVCFDLETGEYKNYGAVSDVHYGAGFWISGEWEGKMIFSASYNKDDRPFMEALHEYAAAHGMTDTKAMGEYTATMEFITTHYEADLSTGEVKPLELPEPSLITGKGYYYLEDGRLKCLTKGGDTLELADAPDPVDVQYLNGWLFYRRGEKFYLMNEDDRTEKEVAVGSWSPQWIIGDNLIYMQSRDIIDEETGAVIDTVTEYIKKPISELIV